MGASWRRPKRRPSPSPPFNKRARRRYRLSPHTPTTHTRASDAARHTDASSAHKRQRTARHTPRNPNRREARGFPPFETDHTSARSAPAPRAHTRSPTMALRQASRRLVARQVAAAAGGASASSSASSSAASSSLLGAAAAKSGCWATSSSAPRVLSSLRATTFHTSSLLSDPAAPDPVPLSKLKDSFNDATSVTYLEELEQRYRRDPRSVDMTWASFFRSLGESWSLFGGPSFLVGFSLPCLDDPCAVRARPPRFTGL